MYFICTQADTVGAVTNMLAVGDTKKEFEVAAVYCMSTGTSGYGVHSKIKVRYPRYKCRIWHFPASDPHSPKNIPLFMWLKLDIVARLRILKTSWQGKDKCFGPGLRSKLLPSH